MGIYLMNTLLYRILAISFLSYAINGTAKEVINTHKPDLNSTSLASILPIAGLQNLVLDFVGNQYAPMQQLRPSQDLYREFKVSASENGTYLAAIDSEGILIIWQLQNGKYQEIQTLNLAQLKDKNKGPAYQDKFSEIQFSADGSYLMLSTYVSVYMFKLKNKAYQLIQKWGFDTIRGKPIFWNNGKNFGIAETHNIYIYQLDEKDGKYKEIHKIPGIAYEKVVFAPSGTSIINLTSLASIRVIQLIDGLYQEVYKSYSIDPNWVFKSIATDGTHIAALLRNARGVNPEEMAIAVMQLKNNKMEQLQYIPLSMRNVQQILLQNKNLIVIGDTIAFYKLNNNQFEFVDSINPIGPINSHGVVFLSEPDTVIVPDSFGRSLTVYQRETDILKNALEYKLAQDKKSAAAAK
jgi:hypothetical protein